MNLMTPHTPILVSFFNMVKPSERYQYFWSDILKTHTEYSNQNYAYYLKVTWNNTNDSLLWVGVLGTHNVYIFFHMKRSKCNGHEAKLHGDNVRNSLKFQG